jgi:hypothetical protein
MPGTDESRNETPASEADALAKALELELMGKRAAWQRASARRGQWRALSFLFLFLVIIGALVAYFYLIPMVSRRGVEKPASEAENR